MCEQPIDRQASANDSKIDAPNHRPDRSFNRRLFSEITKMQIVDAPLGWSRRRELVRFARKLGIDAFEAKLLIRAVEYELGLTRPAVMDDRRTDADTRLVAVDEDSIRGESLPLLGPIAVMATLLLTWLITSRF